MLGKRGEVFLVCTVGECKILPSRWLYGSLAQLVERVTVNHDVVGSSPTGTARQFRPVSRRCATDALSF